MTTIQPDLYIVKLYVDLCECEYIFWQPSIEYYSFNIAFLPLHLFFGTHCILVRKWSHFIMDYVC